jgi:hypothetical protein
VGINIKKVYATVMQLTGQMSAASFSHVSLATDAFVGTDLPSTILKLLGHAATQAPQPMQSAFATVIFAMISPQ